METISSYDKQRKTIAQKLALKAKMSGNKLLKEVAMEKDTSKQNEKEINRRMADAIFYKALENYDDNECTFEECIKEMVGALKALITKK